ncbi:hypothetical protein WISP_41046 [Willisornis vidua]|uniref:Uncharacterized protein n=1 Tax=Willisornis vidua TaxID=1566151 RepID=A0ABQ9DMY6_9PASS|nr:hypothetical protein WISP_41046 [Willisornis vidua]
MADFSISALNPVNRGRVQVAGAVTVFCGEVSSVQICIINCEEDFQCQLVRVPLDGVVSLRCVNYITPSQKATSVADTPERHNAIQRDLDKLKKWTHGNVMSFNTTKCKELLLSWAEAQY